MRRNGLNKKLIALFALFCVMLNYPLLGIFQRGDMLWGLPRLYLSIFMIWLLFILFMMFLIARRKERY